MNELVRYDAMCRAIDAAYEVDEVKDIRDKARAWEVYSQQAHNVEAERRACEIRLRAERKAGQLLKEREKAKPPGDNQYRKMDRTHNGTDPKTLAELGVSKRQSSDWQKLADMPGEDFEAGLAEATKPTTRGFIDPPKSITPVGDKALWLWGTLRDFRRMGILSSSQEECLSTMTESMMEDVLRIAPEIVEWLTCIKESERAEE